MSKIGGPCLPNQTKNQITQTKKTDQEFRHIEGGESEDSSQCECNDCECGEYEEVFRTDEDLECEGAAAPFGDPYPGILPLMKDGKSIAKTWEREA